MGKTLAEASGGRANNTAFTRFILTSVVIYSHSFAIVWGSNASEPVNMITGRQASAGALAVEGFLILSGFLITRSWFFSKGLVDFLRRRILRIYPAFLTAVVVCGLILIPRLSEYDPAHGSMSFWKDMMLPAVLLNYTPLWSNGSVWILPYEFACYLMIALLGVCGALSQRRLLLTLWVVNCGVYVAQIHWQMFASHNILFSRLLNSYLAGVVFFLYRDSIRLHWAGVVGAVLGLGLFGVALAHKCYLPFVSPVLLGYVLLFACYRHIGRLQHFACYGDFSYGTFLYAYPTQLLFVMYLGPWRHPLTLFAAVWPVAILWGVLSWFVVERPFINLKKRPTPAAPQLAPVAAEVLVRNGSTPHQSGGRRHSRGLRIGAAGASLLFRGPTTPRPFRWRAPPTYPMRLRPILPLEAG